MQSLIRKTVKRSVQYMFGAAGLEIRARRRGPVRASMDGALQQLINQGFHPTTVIDVGAANETEGLYEEFEKSNILLIEPQVEFEPFLKKVCSNYRAQYVLAAAGAQSGTAILNVHQDKFGSSLLKEIEGASVDGKARQVPVVTIDDLTADRKLPGPYFIKVDVQWAELQVLEGARRTLRETEAVLLEVSLFGTMIGGPQLFDIISWMRNAGFVVYDICGFLYRPLDNALCQSDLVFVQERSRFRQTHAYATPDQRTALPVSAL